MISNIILRGPALLCAIGTAHTWNSKCAYEVHSRHHILWFFSDRKIMHKKFSMEKSAQYDGCECVSSGEMDGAR